MMRTMRSDARDEGGVTSVALTEFKRRLKRTYGHGQRLVARTFFRYTRPELEAAVRGMGIGSGDALLVHSGFDRQSGFDGTPGDVVEALLNVVGPEGNLLMMSMPYRGSSQAYAQGNPLFDVLRTPSAVGLISELFRRRQGVVRSLSPLHPVLACGPLAAWLVADHDQCAYSCGTGTPFERFLTIGGKFLFYDAPYRSLTFMHFVEHSFRERLPVPLYATEPVALRVRDVTGAERIVRQFFFSEAARTRRHFAPVAAALSRRGALKEVRVGHTQLLAVPARAVVECTGELFANGQNLYRGE
jgi:aminoglycoside 3-N-acetyltransferase